MADRNNLMTYFKKLVDFLSVFQKRELEFS
jgi:hypothetical protein